MNITLVPIALLYYIFQKISPGCRDADVKDTTADQGTKPGCNCASTTITTLTNQRVLSVPLHTIDQC